MPDTTLTPTNLTQIEVGASEDSWGAKLNANAGTINGWFGAGPSLKLANGGTGASTAASARTNLGAAASGGNSDITSLSGMTTPLSAGQGGTGRTDAKAAALVTGRTIAITGDLSYISPSFDGSGNVTAAGVLTAVNGNVGTFGGASAIPVITFDAKGRATAVTTVSPSVPAQQPYLALIGTVTPSGTSVATFSSIPNTHKTLVVSLDAVGSGSESGFAIEYSINNGSSWNALTATGTVSAGGSSDVECVIRNANAALGDFVVGTLGGQGNSWQGFVAISANPGGAINAIRVRTLVGNFAGGTIRLLSI
jgi:hypothetical protein